MLLFGLVGAIGVLGASAAGARVVDSGVLNRTQIQDPVGDAGSGPDLSSLTVTTYADGTVSFAVGFANRDLLHPGETAQIFVDLNNDGAQDLNLSIWPDGQPSYLVKWTGTAWTPVRQISIAQTTGSFSVRMSLAGLRDAAGVPVGSAIGVLVKTATITDSGATGKATDADVLPDDGSWIEHGIQGPPLPGTIVTTTTPPTTTSATTTRTAAAPTQSRFDYHATRACLVEQQGMFVPTPGFTFRLPTRTLHLKVLVVDFPLRRDIAQPQSVRLIFASDHATASRLRSALIHDGLQVIARVGGDPSKHKQEVERTYAVRRNVVIEWGGRQPKLRRIIVGCLRS